MQVRFVAAAVTRSGVTLFVAARGTIEGAQAPAPPAGPPGQPPSRAANVPGATTATRRPGRHRTGQAALRHRLPFLPRRRPARRRHGRAQPAAVGCDAERPGRRDAPARGARQPRSAGMPPVDLPDAVSRRSRRTSTACWPPLGQGAPPKGAVTLNVLVGDAAAGQAYFAAKCSSCHSPTGDLHGIGTSPGRDAAAESLGRRRRRRTRRPDEAAAVRRAGGMRDGDSRSRLPSARWSRAGSIASTTSASRSSSPTARGGRFAATATSPESKSRIRWPAHKNDAPDLYRPRHAQCHGLPGDPEMRSQDCSSLSRRHRLR